MTAPSSKTTASALRDRYELVYRGQAGRPNELWQADHTELDILVLAANSRPARSWLTVVLDDHSRAVAGYSVFLGAPSALNLSLALRQAIWHKPDPAWPVHGLPDALYTDHGADFTSDHLVAVAADLHIQHSYGQCDHRRADGVSTCECVNRRRVIAAWGVGGAFASSCWCFTRFPARHADRQ